MCTAGEGEAAKSAKGRGNSAFVKRRQSYRETMHGLRIGFSEQQQAEQEALEESASTKSSDLEEVAAARAARKREKSLARQGAHVEKLRVIQEKKVERQIYRRRDWEEKREDAERERLQLVELLNGHADKWVTEESLEVEVDRAVDQFFIAASEARREVREMAE